jgi:hypothetical protein
MSKLTDTEGRKPFDALVIESPYEYDPWYGIIVRDLTTTDTELDDIKEKIEESPLGIAI